MDGESRRWVRDQASVHCMRSSLIAALAVQTAATNSVQETIHGAWRRPGHPWPVARTGTRCPQHRVDARPRPDFSQHRLALPRTSATGTLRALRRGVVAFGMLSKGLRQHTRPAGRGAGDASTRIDETDSPRARVRAGTRTGLSRVTGPSEIPLQAFLVSLGAVALAEIGDKTQLLSLVLAAKFKKPWPICAGILIASLLSHAIAAELGAWLAHWMTPGVQRWLIGLSFLAVAAWALLPEKEEPVDTPPRHGRGVFVIAL